MADSIKPSLNDARARIARAGDHVSTLEGEIAAVLPAKRTITAMMPGGFFSGGKRTIKAPPLVPILIGETIYNLRAALDYLVHELVLLDTGKAHNGSKFPIESTEESWNRNFPTPEMSGKEAKKRWLHTLTPGHQASIKRLQPAFGCKWTATLQDLSNPDKHRRLLSVVGNADHGPSYHTGSGPVMVQFNITTEVAFEDGALVVETLKLLHEQVANVIKAFDPDFE